MMTSQNFGVCQKVSPRLFAFDKNRVNCKLWTHRMQDSLCYRSTRRYESLLNITENSNGEILKLYLRTSTVDGVNAWEVAEELAGCIAEASTRLRKVSTVLA